MDFFTLAEGAIIKITSVLVVLFLGIIIAKLAGRITKHILAQAEVNRLLKQSGIKAIDQRVGSMVEYAIYAVTGILILQQLGLTRIVLIILTTAAILVLGISLALTFRNFIPNLVQGFFIKKRLKKHIGKEIRIGSVHGKLKSVGIVQSVITNHEKHYIPHSYTKHNFKQLQAS